MSETNPRIILASASPRRAELLRSIGLDFSVEPVTLDEAPLPGESPQDHATRLAIEKACRHRGGRRRTVVIGCDTVVVVGNRILGKPRDAQEAREMLRLLSGSVHTVITAVALRGEAVVSGYCETGVRFTQLDEAAIDWYVSTGEPMDKAGAYGIQSRAALFVTEINGSYSNVVGLPLHIIPSLFGKLGIDFHSMIA